MISAKKHEEILLHSGGDKVILFVHGIFGSPCQFQFLLQEAAQNGFDCEAMLLPGHGGDGKSFLRAKPPDFAQAVYQRTEQLKGRYRQVILAGHSLGGMLSLLTAARLPVEGVVLFNTPLQPRLSLKSTAISARVLFTQEKKDPPYLRDYRDAFSVTLSHPWQAVGLAPNLVALPRLMKQCRKLLPNLRLPLLVLHSSLDEVCAKRNGEVAEGLSPAHVEVVNLPGSRHSFLPEEDKGKALRAFFDYCNRQTAQA